MENKFNIEEVNAWLKEKYGMSYDELSKEFNKAVNLLSESLKQRKEMRDKIDKAIDCIEQLKIEFELYNYITDFDNKINKPIDILKEDK